MARSSVRDSRSTSEKQTQRASTRSRAVFFENVSVYGPKMMCETSERGTAGTRTRAIELFAGPGAAGPGATRGGRLHRPDRVRSGLGEVVPSAHRKRSARTRSSGYRLGARSGRH